MVGEGEGGAEVLEQGEGLDVVGYGVVVATYR